MIIESVGDNPATGTGGERRDHLDDGNSQQPFPTPESSDRAATASPPPIASTNHVEAAELVLAHNHYRTVASEPRVGGSGDGDGEEEPKILPTIEPASLDVASLLTDFANTVQQ